MNTKILFLADANSPHTFQWAKAIMDSGYIVGIFCFYKIDMSLYADFKNVKLYSLNISRDLQSTAEDNFSKIIYLKAVNEVKRIIKDFNPDIVHAHYASSYGLIGALSGFHPYIISMWGSDVFGFPNYSYMHKSILKFNLSKADKLLSTSYTMKTEAGKYTKKEILVTPFGIDVNRFKPETVNNIFTNTEVVIGTIKTLEKIYGIEDLIKAFQIVKLKLPDRTIKLLLVGAGTQRKNLEHIAADLHLEKDIIFTGYVSHNEVDKYHKMLDIFVAVSLQESFGVSVLEASACGKPVIVSKVGGLPEVVANGETGIIVESKNSNQLADALITLINNPDLRKRMGDAGRLKVIQDFSWDSSVKKMLLIYHNLLNGKN